jgi:hypothetical protein
VYYPSTLHFTRQNWYIPQLVYIVGLWDARMDRRCSNTSRTGSCDQTYDVTFTLDQHATVMDPYFSRRLYTYPGTTFGLVNRHVRASHLYLGSFKKQQSDGSFELCATAYDTPPSPEQCSLVYTQPGVIPLSAYLNEAGRGGTTDSIDGETIQGQSFCMEKCFTTESGVITYATAYLTQQPSSGTYVQYGVAVSDPTEAAIVSAPFVRTSTTQTTDNGDDTVTDYFGQIANSGGSTNLVFTKENWNLGISVAIQGVEDCTVSDYGECGVREDGDIPYFVDFFMIQTDDKKFTDIEGTRLPMVNQDQVINRIAVATDYNCKVYDSETDNAGNFYDPNGWSAGGALQSPIQEEAKCWDPNVTAVWHKQQTARYDYAGDRAITVVYGPGDDGASPFWGTNESSLPTPQPTASSQPTRGYPSSKPPTLVPTASPTAQDFETYAVGCVLDEAGSNPCALRLSVCQASTDAVPYEKCDVLLPYSGTYQVGIEKITIDVWLDDPTEAEFVAAPEPWPEGADDSWYTLEYTYGTRYCDDTDGSNVGDTKSKKVDYYTSAIGRDSTRPCTANSSNR